MLASCGALHFMKHCCKPVLTRNIRSCCWPPVLVKATCTVQKRLLNKPPFCYIYFFIYIIFIFIFIFYFIFLIFFIFLFFYLYYLRIFIWYSISTKACDLKKRSSSDATLLSYVTLCLLGQKLWDVWSHSACKISSKNDAHLSSRINPQWLVCTTTN